MASVFKFGDYTHPDNEVNMTRYEVSSMRSKRNNQTHKLYRLHVNGVIKETGAALNTRIQEIIEAYQYDLYAGDATYTVNGLLTPHSLTQVNSSSGIRIKYRSWPEGKAAELANSRTFTIILESVQIETNGNTPSLLWFQDTISHIGTGGPSWGFRRVQGNPVRRKIWPSNTAKIIQEGSSLGLNGHVRPEDLAPAFYAAAVGDEHEEERVRKSGSGVWNGKAFQNFPYHWRYVYESSAAFGRSVPVDI